MKQEKSNNQAMYIPVNSNFATQHSKLKDIRKAKWTSEYENLNIVLN